MSGSEDEDAASPEDLDLTSSDDDEDL